MKIHEYQAKELFAKYNIPVQKGYICTTPDEVKKAATELNCMVVVKAQVHAGGRGKAGGIKLAKTPEEAYEKAGQILGMELKGLVVEKVLVSNAVNIEKEYYFGFINDRNTKSVMLMASAEGGVEIEQVAKDTPDLIYKAAIDPQVGLLPFQAREVAFKLNDDINFVRQAADIFIKLYKLYVETDSTLAEINPLALTDDNKVLALDGKMNFDDNALFRQPDVLAMRELDEDEKKEIEAKEKGLSYIKLDGNIGCMVNGAGLAMATMDMITLYGGRPANFLDIGGSSNQQKVVDAMNILLSDTNVQGVMINIFGGITRCDDVAKGLLTALEKINTNKPIVVRLTGTNEEEGKKVMAKANLPMVDTMPEAAEKIMQLIG